ERTAQVALLLDGSPALPGSGGALADRAGNWQRVEWQWAEADPIIEYPSAESAIHDVGLRMAPNGPGSVDLLERERWLARVLIFWTLAILGLVVIATGAPPAV